MVARRHHYVPKCYLKSFSLNNGRNKKFQLLVFDAASKKRFVTASENVALERDFNTIDLDGHPPDAFENAMASVESEISSAVAHIVETKPLASENDRTLLLNLIGLLHVRNPRLREITRSFRERVAQRILDIALSSREMWDSQMKKAKNAGAMAQDADTDYDKMKKSYSPANYKIEIPSEEHVRSEMDTFNHALPFLFERKWVLVKAPEDSPGFVTCDHPVSLTWSEPQFGRIPLGLRTKGTEIFFPISPNLAVVGAFELENGEADFNDEQVASSNGTTILNAHRQVYAGRDDFRYQIDQKQKPQPASALITDKKFTRSA
ncbi:MAG TPA: DUF4238 domain-containing protein [Pseudolabrys sp.]|nr:DUF4238 domain-containing protein [Pseudolabrys sp.]